MTAINWNFSDYGFGLGSLAACRYGIRRRAGCGRLLLLAILQDDRQLYGLERLFDNQQFENFELAESARSRPPPRLLGQRYLEFDRRQLLR